MNSIDVRAIQVAYGDDESVAARVERVAGLVADQAGADLVVLPELWPHGGFALDTWTERAETLDGPTVCALMDATRASGAWVHAGSIIERGPELGERTQLWNTSIFFDRQGRLVRSYRKIHRFGFADGEPRLLTAGSETAVVEVPEFGGEAPLRIGLATCYDLRFPELFRRLAADGAELVLLPAAWPLARVEHWTVLGRARAIENQNYVVQCNTGGTHAGVPMGGQSQIVDPLGVVSVSVAGGDESVLKTTVDLNLVREYRQQFPALADRQVWL